MNLEDASFYSIVRVAATDNIIDGRKERRSGRGEID